MDRISNMKQTDIQRFPEFAAASMKEAADNPDDNRILLPKFLQTTDE
jgi:hypothetical protein